MKYSLNTIFINFTSRSWLVLGENKAKLQFLEFRAKTTVQVHHSDAADFKVFAYMWAIVAQLLQYLLSQVLVHFTKNELIRPKQPPSKSMMLWQAGAGTFKAMAQPFCLSFLAPLTILAGSLILQKDNLLIQLLFLFSAPSFFHAYV